MDKTARIGSLLPAVMLACTLAAGCSSDRVLTPDSSPPPFTPTVDRTEMDSVEPWTRAHPVGFATLAKEKFGPYWSSGIFLITSVKDWDRHMAGFIQAGVLFETPPPPAPDVDWKHEAVILITLGVRPTTCYDIEIHGVRRHGSTVLVEVTRSRPKLGGRYCYQTYITPYHLVRIERHPAMKRIREI